MTQGEQSGCAPKTILKVIFEIDYLQVEHIIPLCKICTEPGIAFVRTSTGYGFVKLPNGSSNYLETTVSDLMLMRKHSGPKVQSRRVGGV